MKRNLFANLAMAVLLTLGLSVGSGKADQPSPSNGSPQIIAPVVDLNAPVIAPVAIITPEDLYRQVFKIAMDDFLYQDRLTNFAATWEHKYDGKLATQADAEKAINEMLDSLSDGYTYFRNNGQTQTKATATARTNVVSHRMIGTVGYIKIETFGSENAASETEKALNELNKLGARSYIVDLRDNGGGYVAQAFSITSMFIDSGEFAQMKGHRNGKPYLEVMTVTKTSLEDKENGVVTDNRARVANLTGNKPVFILVNGSSASASEMFAGALRDHGRAKLIGTKTYGKGISQLNPNLHFNTSMQITFAKIYQPAGACIHGVGMNPDYAVTNTAQVDAQLARAVELATPKPKVAPKAPKGKGKP